MVELSLMKIKSRSNGSGSGNGAKVDMWPDAAVAAFFASGELRLKAPRARFPKAAKGALLLVRPDCVVCVWPAPKSRLVSLGLSRMNIKSRINGNGNGHGHGKGSGNGKGSGSGSGDKADMCGVATALMLLGQQVSPSASYLEKPPK